MSVRDRVEEALARRLLEQRGLCVHFSFGDPVVKRSAAGPALPDSEEVWAEIKAEAAVQYQTVLDSVDWNRVALEAVGAFFALDEENDPDDFGREAGETGRSIRAALETRDTWPDWAAYWAVHPARPAHGVSREYADGKLRRS